MLNIFKATQKSSWTPRFWLLLAAGVLVLLTYSILRITIFHPARVELPNGYLLIRTSAGQNGIFPPSPRTEREFENGLAIALPNDIFKWAVLEDRYVLFVRGYGNDSRFTHATRPDGYCLLDTIDNTLVDGMTEVEAMTLEVVKRAREENGKLEWTLTL